LKIVSVLFILSPVAFPLPVAEPRNISPIGEKTIAESVLRPLAKLEPDQQREAWTIATSGTGPRQANVALRLPALKSQNLFHEG
jgi:hypothetical protein